MKIVKYFINIVVDLFFPTRCISCNKICNLEHNNLCLCCQKKIKRIELICSVCSHELINNMCSWCSERELFYKKNITLYNYNGVIRELLVSLKYKNKKRLIKYFVNEAAEVIKKQNINVDIITSVPMLKSKIVKRGYNQVKILAKMISKILKIEYKDILKEKKGSKIQKKLGFDNRFINNINRFMKINNTNIYDKNILLIDDVFTTGSTINECSRVLKLCGAKNVYVLTIAIVSKKINNIAS